MLFISNKRNSLKHLKFGAVISLKISQVQSIIAQLFIEQFNSNYI